MTRNKWDKVEKEIEELRTAKTQENEELRTAIAQQKKLVDELLTASDQEKKKKKQFNEATMEMLKSHMEAVKAYAEE